MNIVSSRRQGFTIVELVVTMAVGTLLVVAAIGMYLTVLGQSPAVKTRNTMSTNLQNALNRINDDVRRASNVTTYNVVADPNAPTTKAGYENVPGPDVDTNDQHFWRMGENRLLLNQTPVDVDGNPIYDNAEYAAGAKDTIIYYVHNGSLYRRVVAAAYGNNSISTATCSPRVTEGGCVSSDIKILDNLKASLGLGAFKVTYYDRNGNAVPYTSKDSSGNDIPNYSGFPLTRSIGVAIELESGKVAGTQTVSIANAMRMQFRSQFNIAPEDEVEPYVPPTNGLGEPGLMVGPGGLQLNTATIQGGDTYVKGKVTVGMSGRIGGGPFYSPGTPTNLNVSNIACEEAGVYPVSCATIASPTPPITFTGAFASINGRVCARGQTSTANINPYGGELGLILECKPPDADLPTFNKAAFVSGMTNGSAAGSTASCNGGSVSPAANRTYTSNMSWTFFCNVTISGNMYLQGNLTSTNATLRVAESVGKVRPIIVVNGRINIGMTIQPNSQGTTPYFISFYSADSACSNSSVCTSISSADLKKTLNDYKESTAPISLVGVTGTGSSFYSYFGEVYVSFFTKAGAVGGQRVKVDTSEITLDGKL